MYFVLKIKHFDARTIYSCLYLFVGAGKYEFLKLLNKREAEKNFTIVVCYGQYREKNYRISAGQSFEVKIQYTDISPKEFEATMNGLKPNLDSIFAESKTLELEIQEQLNGLKYGG